MRHKLQLQNNASFEDGISVKAIEKINNINSIIFSELINQVYYEDNF